MFYGSIYIKCPERLTCRATVGGAVAAGREEAGLSMGTGILLRLTMVHSQPRAVHWEEQMLPLIAAKRPRSESLG